MTEFTFVGSSNLTCARYDETTLTLEIEFRNGTVYQYFDVPQSIFDGLTTASSAGSYLNTQIKGNYRYSRI